MAPVSHGEGSPGRSGEEVLKNARTRMKGKVMTMAALVVPVTARGGSADVRAKGMLYDAWKSQGRDTVVNAEAISYHFQMRGVSGRSV